MSIYWKGIFVVRSWLCLSSIMSDCDQAVPGGVRPGPHTLLTREWQNLTNLPITVEIFLASLDYLINQFKGSTTGLVWQLLLINLEKFCIFITISRRIPRSSHRTLLNLIFWTLCHWFSVRPNLSVDNIYLFVWTYTPVSLLSTEIDATNKIMLCRPLDGTPDLRLSLVEIPH